jgi:hypothetical protein
MCRIPWLLEQVNSTLASWRVHRSERADLQYVLKALDAAERVMLNEEEVYFL